MRRVFLQPWALAGALAVVWLLTDPRTGDLAAQVFRAELFERDGFTIWNNAWYGGHHVPGYSVLGPPLGALLGPRLVGALAAVASAALFTALVRDRAPVAAWWFGVGVTADLFIGRTTWALGVALGLAALLAWQRSRPALASGLAVLSSLASPVAGGFLGLVAAAVFIADGERRRAAAAVAVGAVTPGIALGVLFPEGGEFPFVFSAFWPVVAFCLLGFVFLAHRTVRVAMALYLLVAIAAFAVASPMGGNATRLGMLFGGPLVAALLWRERRGLVIAAAIPLIAWQWIPPVREVAAAAGDPAVERSYYEPLVEEIERRGGPIARVEIPFTRTHWEAAYVAPRIPLARGWERQLDVDRNRLFYEDDLTGARYRGWLEENAVRWVALPDAELDYSADDEAELVRGGLAYLRPVWRNEHWRLFEVRGSSGLDGVSTLGADSVELRGPGTRQLPIRYTRWWTGAEVERAGDWLRVTIPSSGRASLRARFP